MQNRKNFLKTAVIGVAGAIGLTLIPSKGLAKTSETKFKTLKYKLAIGSMIEIHNRSDVLWYDELEDTIYLNVKKELDGLHGTLVAYPSYGADWGYGYSFVFEEADGPRPFSYWNLNLNKINKTMQHIIDGTPDPFMDYAEYADEI